MNRRLRVVVFIILIALVIFSTTFILANSFMDYERSHGSSGVITGIITSTEDEEEWKQIDLIVRKIAHVIEYAFLGACVSALCVFIDRVYHKLFYGYFIAYSLFVAVLDEHIQSFSDRASSTSDILLDFLGSVIGFIGVVILCCALRYLIKRKKERKIK